MMGSPHLSSCSSGSFRGRCSFSALRTRLCLCRGHSKLASWRTLICTDARSICDRRETNRAVCAADCAPVEAQGPFKISQFSGRKRTIRALASPFSLRFQQELSRSAPSAFLERSRPPATGMPGATADVQAEHTKAPNPEDVDRNCCHSSVCLLE